ncbi:uncharacterized protein phrf1 [Pholidichthys leucotaenia]
MDEDDSQDELINRSSSHNKGKRAALWAISDDSDDSEEESEGGESESGEEEDEGQINGDEEEEEEDEEDDGEAKPEDGAFGGTSTDVLELSSDEDREKCPICLNSFSNQPVATPQNCEHYFCLDCILEWAKNANSCPVDRISFNSIYLRKCYGGKVKKMITVQKPVKKGEEETVDLDLEQTHCEVCGSSDREDRLLLCDGCDAGYHMECLTPPLNSVPVEEWFCPECEASNRNPRGSAEELSDTHGTPSTARSSTSRPQPHAAGPTRAIARTQQSERVRANVNRHRISQARSSQLAPTYLMQSTWLDETINAVVAGLNTAVYIRDLTPRATSSRKRKSGKRRKVRSKKTSTSKGKTASTGVKRRKRRVKRTKSRKKLVVKKAATPRSRIANNLGIVKDKKSSSLPTVYRPSEHTLSSMRADIGAASLSIYGDPFDLDPFDDHEEDEHPVQVTSLLEAKRRGISCSALRSHQPVARPVTAGFSRRGMDVPQPRALVEAAPVPDLLGSILSGQSMLLMDSSDVVINRDGSLKATKPVIPPSSMSGNRKSSSSGDTSFLENPGISSSVGGISPSLQYSRDLPGSSHSVLSRPLSQSSSWLSHLTDPSASHPPTPSHSELPPRKYPSLQQPPPNRHAPFPGRQGSCEVVAPSIQPCPNSSPTSNGIAPSHTQPKKPPTKPMWMDVSELPRIPKIKRDSSSVMSPGTSQCDTNGSNRISCSKGSNSNGYSRPELGMNNLSGDKGRQQSVDQQKNQADSHAQRHQPAGASSSGAFSNSFASSSSTGCPSSQPRYSTTSSVSFRINSSGNNWHSRRLGIASTSSSRGAMQEHWREKEDEAKKRQLHRDKQMLLAAHAVASKEEDNIYDPFNPTVSDSSSSGDEAESTSQDSSSHATFEERAPSSDEKDELVQSKPELVQVKDETQEMEVLLEGPSQAQESISREVRCTKDTIKVEDESELVDVKVEKKLLSLETEVEKEPCDDAEESEMFNSQTTDAITFAHHSPDLSETERESQGQENAHCAESTNEGITKPKDDSPAIGSTTTKSEQMEDTKPVSASCQKSPVTASEEEKTSRVLKEQHSSCSETDRGKRKEHHSLGQGDGQKERDKTQERASRRSRERRKGYSSSDSSQSSSLDRNRRKRRRSRSRSKDKRRWRSRSDSSSSSRERTRKKKYKQRSKERDDDRRRVSKDKQRGRSRTKSRSKSRSRSRTRSRSRDRRHGLSCSKSRSESRSRSRERRKEHARRPHASFSSGDKESRSRDKRRHRSRSSSRERRKDGSSKSSQKNSASSVSSSKDVKESQNKKKERDSTRSCIKEDKVLEVKKMKEASCPSASKVKKEQNVLRAEGNMSITEKTKEVKPEKEIKKEKQTSLDMFEDVLKPIKQEETNTPLTTSETTKEGVKDSIKTETCEMLTVKAETCEMLTVKTETCEMLTVKSEPCEMLTVKSEPCEMLTVKSEPSSPKLSSVPPVTSFSPPITAGPTEGLQASVSESPSLTESSVKHENTVALTVPIKQEVQQPLDSDDDFNIDVMLDNLDYVKSESADGADATVKQEAEGAEEKNDGGQGSTLAGAKSKSQVKRVTWNIQEPEEPQAEKSASKVALYKLKLKQEGPRRPALSVQTSNQISGAITDPLKKDDVGLVGTSSTSDNIHPGELSTIGQGELGEGDLSRKDKYLKKLHMQERAVEEVKLAIKPFYQRRDINKDEYKEILRKAVQKVCHSKSGEINPVKVGNLVKAYVDKYKHARKHKKGDDAGKVPDVQTEAMNTSDSP